DGIDMTAKVVKLTVLGLDGVYDKIVPGSRVVVVRGATDVVVRTLIGVDTVTRTAYGMSTRVTQLTLDGDWIVLETAELPETHMRQPRLTPIRSVTVYAQ